MSNRRELFELGCGGAVLGMAPVEHPSPLHSAAPSSSAPHESAAAGGMTAALPLTKSAGRKPSPVAPLRFAKHREVMRAA